ncbi:MAG: Hsp20/alpha crystallin family protein [Chthoniobacterales bacterium]|jgi:HSP20 family protein
MNIVPQENQQLTAENRPQSGPVAIPVVDIESTPEGYVLQAEMPGVNKEGIEVTVENGDLILTGHRHPLEVSGELVHRESRPNDFRRVYELDPSIDTGRITARIENGVLTVNLPKAESVKPRRIELE